MNGPLLAKSSCPKNPVAHPTILTIQPTTQGARPAQIIMDSRSTPVLGAINFISLVQCNSHQHSWLEGNGC